MGQEVAGGVEGRHRKDRFTGGHRVFGEHLVGTRGKVVDNRQPVRQAHQFTAEGQFPRVADPQQRQMLAGHAHSGIALQIEYFSAVVGHHRGYRFPAGFGHLGFL